MPYKDKDKQREATRKAVRKHRGITDDGITEEGMVDNVIPTDVTPREASWLVSHKDMVISKHKQLDLIYRALKEKGLTEEVRIGDLDMGEIGILLGKV